MDSPNSFYPKTIFNASELLSETITTSINISNDFSPITEQVNKIIKQNSLFTSAIFDGPLAKFISEQNNYISQIDFSYLRNIQIAANMPDFSAITQAYKTSIPNLAKCDFRIDVLEQKLSRDITELLKNSSDTIDIDKNYKIDNFNDVVTDFDERLLESVVYTKDNSQQTQDITEIKNLVWEIFEHQKDQINQSFEKDVQKKEQIKDPTNSYQSTILAFVNGVLLTLSVITAPKEVYEFLVWVNQIISFLLNK